VENRGKDIAIHQEFHVGPEIASCGGKLFLESERNRVVQGAVLSVTLFLMAMADIIKGIKETCTILGYADDWVVVISSKTPIRAEARSKEAANSVTRWTSDNGFKISSEKTKT
jgi:hypothetical protein